MTYRVVQWGTGWVGQQAIRGMVKHPDLELVGCWVNNPAKVGQDVGILAGLDPIGVTASNDLDALIALGADCHSYMVQSLYPGMLDLCTDHVRTILAAGQNVAHTSLLAILYPEYGDQELRRTIEEACTEGRTTCYGSGIVPGFMNDFLPLALLSSCERVDRITVAEIINYNEYNDLEEARDMGAGLPLEVVQGDYRNLDSRYAAIYGPIQRALAGRLGLEIDSVRARREWAPATQRIEGNGFSIEPGTVGARRLVVEACIGDRPVIVEDHVSRWDDAAALDWPLPPVGSTGCYRISIDGTLSWSCDFNLMARRVDTDGTVIANPKLAAFVATAMRVVNAIPFVCEAGPGILSALDVDMSDGLHVFG